MNQILQTKTKSKATQEIKIYLSYKVKYTMIIDRAFITIYTFLDAFKQGFSMNEIILNVLFITLFLIISLIIYWDSINVRVSQTSRCKRQMDAYNKNKGTYVVNATDKSKQKLFSVSYDTNQNTTSLTCECEPGKYVNYFNDIPVKNMKNNKDVKESKICSCDKYHNAGIINENIMYDGEPGILRYMTTQNSDFFDNLLYQTYS